MYQEMTEQMTKKIYPHIDDISCNKYKKETIPRALREQVWITYIGKNYDGKCIVSWCNNIISTFDFHVGHNIPEAIGGATDINNLRPICSRCNLSMGSRYSIDEWNKLSGNTHGDTVSTSKKRNMPPVTKTGCFSGCIIC